MNRWFGINDVIRVLVSLLLLSAWVGESSGAQVALSQEACDACELNVTELVHLQGAGVLGEPRSVVMMSDGRIVATFFQAGNEVVVFSADGLTSESIARGGAGPGELGRVQALDRLRGDTLIIADMGNQRLSWFDSTGVFVRSVPLEGLVRDMFVVDSDRILIGGMVSSPEAREFPMHLLESGTVIRSFGRLVGEFNPRIPYQTMRNAVVLPDGHIVTSPKTAYDITVWDSEGHERERFSRDADWFPRYVERTPIGPNEPLDPWFAGMGYVEDDVLLVAINVPAEGWQEHLGEAQRRGDVNIYPEADLTQMYDTRLEAIDLVEGRILHTETIDEAVGGFAAPDVVWLYQETGAGQPSLALWRVELIG